MRKWLAPDVGSDDGKLYIERPTGEIRYLNCRYNGGLGGNDKEIGRNYAVLDIEFRAVNPFFYKSEESSYTFTQSASVGTFLGDPFFPLFITEGAIYNNATFDYGGDAETYPVWTIKGAGDSLILRNLTTGKFLSLQSYTIQDGETVTIDTRFGEKSIENADGDNLMEYMAELSSLWALQPGENSIRVELSNTNGNTEVSIAYHERYKEA